MNKKVTKISLIILFIVLIIPVYNVSAYDAGAVDKMITNYNLYTEKLSTLDCSDENDEDLVHKCNTYKLEKNLIITELMSASERNEIPDEKKDEVDEIIKENKNKCGKIFDDYFTNLVNSIMKIFYIAGPILLVIFGTLDYSKVVVSSEKDALKKANQKFLKRIAATIFLFLSPALTNLIISLNSTDYRLSGNAYVCEYDYKIYKQKYEISYVENKNKFQKQNKSSTSGGGGGTGKTVSGINFTTNYSNMIYKGGVLPIPFPEDNVTLSSYFGYRESFATSTGTSSSNHKGVDIVGPIGTKILAVADGVVTISSVDPTGYGYWVEIQHQINGQVFFTRYAHMRSMPFVRPGQNVNAGTELGIQGESGSATGEHLHFEVRMENNENPVNPLKYLLGKDTIEAYTKW